MKKLREVKVLRRHDVTNQRYEDVIETKETNEELLRHAHIISIIEVDPAKEEAKPNTKGKKKGK